MPPRPAGLAVRTSAAHRRPSRTRRRLRRILIGGLLVLLLAPPALLLAYRYVPVPITPLMLIRIAEGEGLRRQWVALDEVAPALPQAVVAAEDNRFCEHSGFDWQELGGQIDALLAGERARGASTITMQTAKNLLLWPGRDPVRKALEAWLTPQLALLWPKRRILEVYLNIVEFGPGLYGAEIAARAFFGKPASALSAREAARLAAVLPDPLRWSAAAPGPRVRQRAAVIERRVIEIRPLLGCAR
jgi:monofunctional glycosyltransferase